MTPNDAHDIPPTQQPKRASIAITPLVLISIFVGFTETIAGAALLQSQGNARIALTIFVCAFPFAILVGFFVLLWARPFHLYPPPETADVDAAVKYVKAVTQTGISPPDGQTATEATVAKASTLIVAVKNEIPDSADKMVHPAKKEDDEWEFRMLSAYVEKKGDEGDRCFFAALEIKADLTKKDKLRLWRAYLRFTFLGAADSLTEILKFCKSSESEVKLDALSWAGMCYAGIKDYSNAIVYHAAAVEAAKPADKPKYIVTLAGSLADDGQIAKAVELLCENVTAFVDADAKAVFYVKLASIYEVTEQHELRALAAEMALQYQPTDVDTRFAAGYAYANCGYQHLAVFHYEALVELKRDHAMALNNLGVAYQDLEMPIKSVNRYQRSFEKETSLAGANLAFLLINAGLAKQADEVLEKAKVMKEPHQNVSRANIALSEKRAAEAEKQKVVLKSGREQQRFFREYAEALFLKDGGGASKLQGSWLAASGEVVHVVETQSSISAQWKQDGVVFKMTGSVTNRSAKIEVTPHADNPELLMHLKDAVKKGFAYVTADRREMVWLTIGGADVSVRTFRFVATQSALAAAS